MMEHFQRIYENPDKFEFCPLWIPEVYPTRAYLKTAIENKELYLGTIDDKLIISMILNHRPSEGYETVTWPTPAKEKEILVIHLLALHPDEQKKGYAKAMVRYAMEHGKENGDKVIRLDVLKENVPSAKLYEGMGFRYVITIPIFYEDTGMTDFMLYEYPLTDQ